MAVLVLAAGLAAQAGAPPAPVPPSPLPTVADIAYGPHARQKLDFWSAESVGPAPLVFYLHSGGWVNGDKRDVPNLMAYLHAGISVVSSNYRFTTEAQEAGVWPPIQWPHADVARALQFVRSRAKAWRIDPKRIIASGESAGACSSLWLAFHADLSEPNSADPVARESTRIYAVAVAIAQTSLDPKEMQLWTPNSNYGGHAFGFMPDPRNLKTRDTQFPQFLAARERLLPWINQYSPAALVTADAPPVYLSYPKPPGLGVAQVDPTHTANFGVGLAEKLRKVGVPCELVYPGAPGVQHPSVEEYIIDRLKGRAGGE